MSKKATAELEVPKEKKRRRKSNGSKNHIFLIAGIVMAAVFLSSSVLLVVGMLPTVVALVSDPRKGRTKAVTVGAINLAGCVPFLLELWSQGHTLDQSFEIIMDPKAIIVMYSAAVIGYMLDWAMSSIVASVLYQRGTARKEAILRRQEELVLRWGEEVTGSLPLDQFGFPLTDPSKQR